MTQRLYYDDAYLTQFDATVVQLSERGGKPIAALDRSAFYPTSGGQPFDTGALNGARVTDVFVDAQGEVWHEFEGELRAGETVHGSIDWPRRLDHMQQHGGEHMIAGAVHRLLGGMTVGLHLGPETSSIDVELPGGATHLSEADIERVEDDVNAHILEDHPIRCWFPEPEELAALPLRKRPTVKEHVRIVAMGDFEMVACGGTHPSSTGQIGLVKIVSAAPARGKLRLSFVCGSRAIADYRKNYNCAWAAANLLSTRPEMLAHNVENLMNRLREAELSLNRLRREKLLSGADELLAGAETLPGGVRLICAEIAADAEGARELASKLVERPGVCALLAARAGEKHNYVFARGADVRFNMGALLSAAARPLGGKGGGRPDFAQGGGPLEALWAAKAMLERGEAQ